MIDVRLFRPADWDVLLDLANEAIPFAPQDNLDWLSHRRAFDESSRLRRHYLALRGDEPVGYGGLEQQSEDPGLLRVFVVASPTDLRGEVGDLLYERLLDDARSLGTSELWARELQADEPVQAFLTSHGFVEAQRFTLPDLPSMVVFRLGLTRDTARNA